MGMNKIFSDIFYPLFFLIGVLVFWQMGVEYFSVPMYLFPKPTEILKAAYENSAELLEASLSTLRVTVTSCVLSNFLGVLVAIILFSFKNVSKAILPYMIVLQTTPMVVLVPLFVIWFRGESFIILTLCGILASIFPVITTMLAALSQIDPSLEKIFKLYGVKKLSMLFKLYLPSALPHFLGQLQISAALSLIGCVSAGFMIASGGAGSGLSYLILMSGYNLETDKLFAALFAVALLGLLLHFASISLKKLAN